MNAMAIGINVRGFGGLIDPFGGKKDLEKRQIRVLHGKSFLDDPTRILRAVRFEQRFGFKIEPHTLKLLKGALLNSAVHQVKPQRYFSEVRKMLKEPLSAKCFLRLKKLNGLKLIDASLKLDSRGTNSFLALFEKVSLKDLERLLKKFPFLKEERESLRQNRERKKIIDKLSQRGLARGDVYRLLKSFHEDVLLHWRTQAPVHARKKIDQFLRKDRYIKVYAKGEDLRRIGVPAGERMGEILEAILYQRLDGKICTKREELKFARSYR